MLAGRGKQCRDKDRVSVSATDADNDDASLRYAIDPASDLFGIGESDGQITLSVATNFNYEKGEKEYTLTVQVRIRTEAAVPER